MASDKIRDQAMEAQEIYQGSPLVPLTLRIGVTGHRPHKLPQGDRTGLTDQIREVLIDLYAITKSIQKHKDAEWIYNTAVEPCVRITSALAEGADRMMIDREALDFDFELQAVLPFLQDVYERDFAPGMSLAHPESGTIDEFRALLKSANQGTPAARIVELDGDSNKAEEAYHSCGRFIVRHSDLLVAIWDKTEKDGGRGGTADVISLALAEKTPVICISAKPPHTITLLGDWRLPPENIEHGVPVYDKTRVEDYDKTQVETFLTHHLLFSEMLKPGITAPEAEAGANTGNAIRQRFSDFCNEKGLTLDTAIAQNFQDEGPLELTRSSLLRIERLFVRLRNFIAPQRRVTKVLEKWGVKLLEVEDEIPMIPTASGIDPKCIPSLNRFYSVYLRSDRLSNYYANLHRSIFMSIYILGALALSAATAALYFRHVTLDLKLSTLGVWEVPVDSVFVWIEMIILTAIIVLWGVDHHRRYHDRWIEYRCLAEFLRPLTYLSLLGSTYPLNEFRDAEQESAQECLGHGGRTRSWILAYAETVIRHAGVPRIRMDHAYLERCRDAIGKIWIDSQLDYHARNAARMHIMGRRLHNVSFLLFWGTVIAVGIKLVFWGNTDFSLAALLAAILPALASAAFAIRNHAEFDISAQRSQTMRVRLNRLRVELQKAPCNSEALIAVLRRTADTTMKETADWMQIFEVRTSETA